MKRFSKIILSFILVLVVSFVVIGCKGKNNQNTENSNSTETTVQQANNGSPREEPERKVEGEPDPYDPEEYGEGN